MFNNMIYKEIEKTIDDIIDSDEFDEIRKSFFESMALIDNLEFDKAGRGFLGF